MEAVCNVDAAVGGHCDAPRVVKFTVTRALSAPFANGHAFGGELLDAVVVRVRSSLLRAQVI